MSYIKSYPVRSSGNVRLRGMGDIWSEFKKYSNDDLRCINVANASPQVASIEAEISRLVTSWRPTGYYRPAEVQTLLDTLATQAAAAGAAVAAAPMPLSMDVSTYVTNKREAMNDMLSRYQARATVYQQALATARSSGANVIDAPGLKDWVISSMLSIANAYTLVAFLHCQDSWIGVAFRAIAAIGAVAYRILGVAYDAAALVVKAADGAINLAGLVIKYGPVAAVGLGAYVLYNMMKKRRGG